MYNLINRNIKAILAYLTVNEPDYVTKYIWLCNNFGDDNYRPLYSNFWKLQGMSEEVRNTYFQELQNCIQQKVAPNVGDIQSILYNHRLYFSFATKLAHMVDYNLPIYDSRIAAFYIFIPPTNGELPQRLNRRMSFYDFLKEEYRRILDNNLLALSIQEFHQHFQQQINNQYFSDIKIIDSLIWAFVGWRNAGTANQDYIIQEAYVNPA